MYNVDTGVYPATQPGLKMLTGYTLPATATRPAQFIRMFKKIPLDPWGRDYVYVGPTKQDGPYAALFSCGPNGQPGDGDDLAPPNMP